MGLEQVRATGALNAHPDRGRPLQSSRFSSNGSRFESGGRYRKSQSILFEFVSEDLNPAVDILKKF